MQVAIGEIVEGKVTGITKFGAFVELPGGKTGMVHISEVAPTYVKEIKDHLTIGQEVRVKVLAVSEEGKISLSIKRAMDQAEGQGRQAQQGRTGGTGNPADGGNHRGPRQGGGARPRYHSPQAAPVQGGPAGFEWTPRNRNENMSFEDMMTKFKQSSDDKMSDLKKYMDVKSGSRRGK